MVKQRNQTRRQRQKKTGGSSGLVETGAVPFGLFAIQHLFSRKKNKTNKKRRRTNKSYKNKSNRYYKK